MPREQARRFLPEPRSIFCSTLERRQRRWRGPRRRPGYVAAPATRLLLLVLLGSAGAFGVERLLG